MPGRKASKYYARKVGGDKRISLGEKSGALTLAYTPTKGDDFEDVTLGVILRERNGKPELLLVNAHLPQNLTVSVVHGKTVSPIVELTATSEMTELEGQEYEITV